MSGYTNNDEIHINKNSKKTFNKKKWREQKYSCRGKVQKWERIKQKQAQRQYNRDCKKLKLNMKSKNENTEHKTNKPYKNFQQIQLQHKAIQQINEEKRKEKEKIKKEKLEAIKAYKKVKAAKFQKLSQKTRKGQPLMRGRIELLLEKIQKNYVNNKTQINL